MRQSVRLGKVAGIPVEVHWTAGVVLIIVMDVLGAGVLPTALPHRPAAGYWAGAAVAALVFLGSLLVHELAHALVASRNGVRMHSITLWMLGGMTEMDDEPPGPGADLRIALAGPAASLAEAAVFGVVAGTGRTGAPVVATVAAWLAVMNAVIAVFNLLPGAPLDGGRVLHALLWRRYHDNARAAVAAAKAGRFLGLVIISAGVTVLLAHPGLDRTGLDGIWLVVIGWFLASAAATEERVAVAMTAVAGLRVADVMTAGPRVAAGDSTVQDFLRQAAPEPRQSAFPVLTGGELAGVVTVGMLGRIRGTARTALRLDQVAVGVPPRYLAAPEDPAAPLLGRPLLAGEVAAVVLIDGLIVGLVTGTGLSDAVWRAVGAMPRRGRAGEPGGQNRAVSEMPPGAARPGLPRTPPRPRLPGAGLAQDCGHPAGGPWSRAYREQRLWVGPGRYARLMVMATNFATHRTTASGQPHHEWPQPGVHAGYRDELRQAERACCCSASPAVIAVLPPTPGRAHHTGLTLCAHHYRASRARLAAAGAAVYDRDGKPVVPEAAAFATR